MRADIASEGRPERVVEGRHAVMSPPNAAPACERAPQGTFAWCPLCDGRLEPEHAHYRCTGCGWRDSCCD